MLSTVSGGSPDDLALATLAADQLQIATPSPTAHSVYPGQALSFDVNYTTSTDDATLTGLGVRMHYNSARLAYTSLTSVFGSPLQQQAPQSDTANADGDASTDKYVLVSWVSPSGDWPGTLPARLYTANFTAVAGATGTTYVRFSASSTAGGYTFSSTPATIQFLANSNLVGRRIFYNASSFDGNSTSANASDDNAIATDKTALLPGQQATYQNYTTYSRGINGVMVDFDNLPGSPTLSDFQFKVGNTNTPSNWASPSVTPTLTVRTNVGTGLVDRVTLIWTDGAIAGKWLQVTVLPSTRTGLAASDVFYFGNAPGETGNSPGNAQVDGYDYTASRSAALAFSGTAAITNQYDVNRDSLVNASDMLLVRGKMGHLGSALDLITPSVSASLTASFAATTETAILDALWADTVEAPVDASTGNSIDPALVTVPVEGLDVQCAGDSECTAAAMTTADSEEDLARAWRAAAARKVQDNVDLFADAVDPLVADGGALAAVDAILQDWDDASGA